MPFYMSNGSPTDGSQITPASIPNSAMEAGVTATSIGVPDAGKLVILNPKGDLDISLLKNATAMAVALG